MEMLFKTWSWLVICVTLWIQYDLISSGVPHQVSLIWTEKRLDGSVRIMGIPGEPREWMDHGIPDYVSYGSPANLTVRRKSHRTALGFQYATRHLFFSDIGYREIFRMKLGDSPDFVDSVTHVKVEPVFSGISTKVQGLTVDWNSGNVYWTDMTYNWITVALGGQFDIYRHIITTGLDKPFGITAHPKKGYLFWTDQGAIPKVERSFLDGSGRTTVVSRQIYKPTGITVDYAEDQVYWLDDEVDKMIRMDLDGGNRINYVVKDPEQSNFQFLNGIDVYKDYVIISDQLMLNIKLYDKDMSFSRGTINLPLTTPYDVMMYDSERQEDFASECDTLSCPHMCVNMGNGKGQCLCSQGYTLSTNGMKCEKFGKLHKPQYIFSVGSQICTSDVRKANLDSDLHKPSEGLQCLHGNLAHVEALAVDVYADLLFFSDTEKGTISRTRLNENSVTETHALQVGDVRGLAVDWINSHLYWTDEVKGHIMVSNLDGRLPTELLANLNRPRGLVVDPAAGYMYWSTVDAIYRANMDGSDKEVFVGAGVHSPDGLFINYMDDKLYWADNILHGIYSVSLNGSDVKPVLTMPDMTFRDVTGYQEYIVWTDGTNRLYFWEMGNKKQGVIPSVEYKGETVSHDILLYDESAQPLEQSPCDMSNGGCSQLCLPRPGGRTCACTIGFVLDTDSQTCKSDIRGQNIVMFTDPFQKSIYQVDPFSTSIPAAVQGIELHSTAMPTALTYDTRNQMIYWYDSEARVIKRKLMTTPRQVEEVVATLQNSHVDSMVVNDDDRMLLYTDSVSGAIMGVPLENNLSVDTMIAGPVMTGTLAWEQQSKFMFWAMDSPTSGLAIYKGRPGSLPNKLLVVDNIPLTVINGLAIDDKIGRMYWWNEVAIYSGELNGNDVGLEHTGNIESPILSVAAYDNVLFISESNKQTIFRYDLVRETFTEFTPAVFSNIRSLKIYTEGTPDIPTIPSIPTLSTRIPTPASSPATSRPSSKTPTPGRTGKTASPTEPLRTTRTTETPKITSTAATSQAGGNQTLILAVACAGGGAVLLIIIIVIVVVVRRKRNNKKPKNIELDAKAHENPTYMRADEVPPRPVMMEPVSETRGAVGADSYPVKDGAPFDDAPDSGPRSPQGRELPAIVPMGMGLNAVESDPDTSALVDNMADQSEVTLTMDGGENTIVAYSPDRA